MPKAVRANLGLYCFLLLSAGALYVLTCAPGLLWQDSGLLQYRLWRGDIEGTLGLALSHPLFYILGMGFKHLPLGDVSYRANLIASLAGAVTIANLGLVLQLYTGRRIPAMIGAVTLAVAHTFWWHACAAETYTLWAALFTGELLALLQYERTERTGYLYLLGALNGMAVAVHMLACIPLICYAVAIGLLVARKKVRLRAVGLIVVLWTIGAAPYGYLIAQRMIETGQVLGTLSSAAFGDRWQGDVLNVGLSWAMVRDNGLLMLLNCPSPNGLLFFVGVAILWKARIAPLWSRTVLVLMVLLFLFAFRYNVVDRFAFFIPFYVTAAVCIGLGSHWVLDRTCGKWSSIALVCCALLPAVIYGVLPKVARQMNVSLGTRGDVPYRDDYTYFLQPWKRGYHGADHFANEVFDTVLAGAVIYADSTTAGPLLYAQEARDGRSDVRIVTGVARPPGAPAHDAETFKRLIERYPIYVTSTRPGYCPAFILDGPYKLVRRGPLWRIRRNRPAMSRKN